MSSNNNDERVIHLNLTFFELAFLEGCIQATKQQFVQKKKNGLNLEDMEEKTLGVINALYDIVEEQAKASTVNFDLDNLAEELQNNETLNEIFASTYMNVLNENFSLWAKQRK